MERKVIDAEVRTALKKGHAGRLRRSGKIPAVMYGHSGTTPVSVDAHDFHRKFRTISENTIIELNVGSTAYNVLVKDYQEDILTGTIKHIDFFEIEAGKTLRTHIPVRIEGTPIGVREGGILEHMLYSVEVECLPKDIPEEIALDVTKLAVGDSVHVGQLTFPDSVRVMSSSDQVVVAVTTVKGAETEEETAAEEGVAEEGAEADKEEDAEE
jgi:large subunit ribosomal protein L25